MATTTTRLITEEAAQEMVRKALVKAREIAIDVHLNCSADDYWGNGVAMYSLKQTDEESYNVLKELYDLTEASGTNGAVRLVGGTADSVVTIDGSSVTVPAGETVDIGSFEGRLDFRYSAVSSSYPHGNGGSLEEIDLVGKVWNAIYIGTADTFVQSVRGMFPSDLEHSMEKFGGTSDALTLMPGKPTSLLSAFSGCSSLTSLKLSSWDTSACTTMYFAFSD
ncbi:MAG: hypothetical protein LUI09_05740, partial [Prevotellaceae bacterium]|nr:hypothetical protein [Prevotellaceae bacterium]